MGVIKVLSCHFLPRQLSIDYFLDVLSLSSVQVVPNLGTKIEAVGMWVLAGLSKMRPQPQHLELSLGWSLM